MNFTTWKLTWNSKYYDYKKLINDYNNERHNGIICQQYQNKKKVYAKIDDIVYISCNKKKIIKANVISNVRKDKQPEDKYDIGTHNSNDNKWCLIKIIEVYDNPDELKGNQNTWCKYNA